MFITYSEAEVPLGLLAGKSDVRHWHYAELSLPCVWFYVSIGYQRSDKFGQTTLLLASIREFEQLLSDRDADMWLEDVMVVTPGSVNGCGHWRMDRLNELSEAVESNTGQLTYVYGLEDGRLVIEGPTADPSSVQSERTIFSIQRDITNAVGAAISHCGV
ncbi:hypothetical protein QLG10_02440 [Pseudomonas sp. V98_8]|uniref:hypothetical protein n=1 Tax=Pseudomonas sp. V98_8 TaxID=3044228 RepID=UPI00249F13C6|nr:hypothetical protein [Pseudomonas sp. V98_8]MDI3391286.1 hypothetical protein [Pseudomonas sp. V98_8]